MDVEKEDTNMSMEITNNYGNYITGYANAAKKTGSTESKNEEEKGVKTSTVELKTSTHGVMIILILQMPVDMPMQNVFPK